MLAEPDYSGIYLKNVCAKSCQLKVNKLAANMNLDKKQTRIMLFRRQILHVLLLWVTISTAAVSLSSSMLLRL